MKDGYGVSAISFFFTGRTGVCCERRFYNVMKLSVKKVVLLALGASLLAGGPIFRYSVSDATGNSSGTVSSVDAPASGSSGGSSYVAPPPAPQNNRLNGTTASTKGAYDAWSVPGIIVEVNAAAAGVQSGSVFVRTWDVTESGSPAATASLKAAAASVGAVMGPTVEIDIRVRNGRQESELTGATSTLQIGIPSSFRKDGARYAVARVVSGGQFTIIDGEVSNNIFKFSAPSGNAAYALLRYDN